MSRTTLKVVGTLRYSEHEGLRYSLSLQGKDGRQTTSWEEAFPSPPNEWPGIGKYPEKPKSPTGPYASSAIREQLRAEHKKAEEQWALACEAYWQAVHASQDYKEAATKLVEGQRREPRFFFLIGPQATTYWAYRDKMLALESTDPEVISRREDGGLQIKAEALLLIKHHVLRKERYFQKVRREVEALENLEKLQGVSREPIPESVRLLVWQRDKGQCVKCGSRERLEFDHIIPITAGGSSTERNVQLLCESCNRSKGATI